MLSKPFHEDINRAKGPRRPLVGQPDVCENTHPRTGKKSFTYSTKTFVQLSKRRFHIKSFIIVTELRRSVLRVEGPVSSSLRLGSTTSFKEMSQRWRSVGNTLCDLTGPRFEPQTSRSRDERLNTRPTGRYFEFCYSRKQYCTSALIFITVRHCFAFLVF